MNKTFEAGASTSSDLIVPPEGSVLCLYENADSIACLRFNLEWIAKP